MIRLQQINATPGGMVNATLDQPIDHLLACHRRIEERLEILERATDHLPLRNEEALEAIRNCFRFLDSNGAWHTADEEESIFTRLRGLLPEKDYPFLSGLEDDHRQAELVYKELKDRFESLSDSVLAYAADSLAGFREQVGRLSELYRNHIAAEEASLLGMARAVLNEEQLSVISREMKARRGLAS